MKRFEELQILIDQLYIKIYNKYDYCRGDNVKSLIKSQKEINVLQKQLNDYIEEYESLI
jgi:hypothetical protein